MCEIKKGWFFPSAPFVSAGGSSDTSLGTQRGWSHFARIRDLRLASSIRYEIGLRGTLSILERTVPARSDVLLDLQAALLTLSRQSSLFVR
jgi:hypothetical protein